MTVRELKKIISQPSINDDTMVFLETEKGVKCSTILYDQDFDSPDKKGQEKIIVIGSRT